MSKQLTSQRFIYKIHSTRLKRAKWKLTLPMSEARRNKEVVSLSDSQVIRWLDELNGITDADERAVQIKKEIKALRREADKVANRKRIKQLYEERHTLYENAADVVIETHEDVDECAKRLYNMIEQQLENLF